MNDDAAGIYVHIPFCLTRCGYCDFNAYAGLDELKPRYLAALLAEAELAAPGWEGTRFVSVFLGGGTPTTIAPADLRALLVHLRDRFALAEDAEITIEANPDTVDVASLRAAAARFRAPVGLWVVGVEGSALAHRTFDSRCPRPIPPLLWPGQTTSYR
jgi:oxygen-independent coproporphyrinogen-3 oxidase